MDRNGIANMYSNSCIAAKVKRIDGIKARCSLICDVNDGKYLRVTPKDIQWIGVGETVVYDVQSNTNWIIV